MHAANAPPLLPPLLPHPRRTCRPPLTLCPLPSQRGHRSSLNSKTVALVLPGGGYTRADLEAFASAAAGADISLLEIVWAIALEGSTPLSLTALTELLFDDAAPVNQYVAYSMLLSDRTYFKQVCAGSVRQAPRQQQGPVGGGGGGVPYAAVCGSVQHILGCVWDCAIHIPGCCRAVRTCGQAWLDPV